MSTPVVPYIAIDDDQEIDEEDYDQMGDDPTVRDVDDLPL